MTETEKPYPENAFVIVNGADIIPLNKAVINIGRMSDNDIVLPNAHVSRYHAQIKGMGGKFVLEDLQSTSGTSVNGSQITRKILAPGDVISLAGIPIIYGESSGPDKFNQKSLGPRTRPSASPQRSEATDAVDISELDRLLEMFDFQDEDIEGDQP